MTKAKRCDIMGILVLLIGAAQPAAAQPAQKDEPPRVVATASATAYVKPDAARLTFAVTASEEPERSARQANDKQIKKLKDQIAALPLGTTQTEIVVLPAGVSTIVAGQQNPTMRPTVQAKRFQSVFQVTVREKEFDKLREAVGRIAETAIDNDGVTASDVQDFRRAIHWPRIAPGAGNNEEAEIINGPSIEWLTTNSADARRDAIRRAVKDARADAEAAAGTAKLKVIEINVTESENGERPGSGQYQDGETAAPQGGFVRIRVEVRMTCTY